jgi:hypothetical protein
MKCNTLIPLIDYFGYKLYNTEINEVIKALVNVKADAHATPSIICL